MAKVGNRQYKTLICTECSEENYRVERNVKKTDRLELNRYCPDVKNILHIRKRNKRKEIIYGQEFKNT